MNGNLESNSELDSPRTRSPLASARSDSPLKNKHKKTKSVLEALKFSFQRSITPKSASLDTNRTEGLDNAERKRRRRVIFKIRGITFVSQDREP